MIRTCILFVLLLLATQSAISAETIATESVSFPMAAKQAIQSRHPSLLDGVQFSEGDIDADGIADIVAIIHYLSEGTEMESIVILKGDADSRFVLLAESVGIEPHPRRNEYVGITKGTISVTASTGTYTEYSGTEYKFKVYSGKVLLIGMETSDGTIGEDKPSHRLSANFLTNKTIVTSWREATRKPIVSTQHLRGDHKIPLEKFCLDGTTDPALLQ